MSTTIDNRVLEMRFDNKQFESGVATTMSTLDKLKQKLNMSDASKGLEGVSRAAKKVDMSGLATGVETVTARFSALQVMGVTALANITNSAVNAGKRMVSALTLDPIKTGFQEYETQMGAIQTILANTQKEGTNVERVNAALDELNTYADKTIYNFTEMARNIGTFTAAGVKLDTSVNAIKGIANLAAISGSTSAQASTAMYQLSQALAAGKVQLMDWNSVVNAGMGGQVFQDALVRTSEHLKTGAKEAINTYGSFRESLTKSGWLTTEVLTETLNQIAGAYTEAELMAQGYSETQAKEIMNLAKTAEAAATEVKTFSQLWDTLKEAAQSGWGQTWRLIVGDFEQAKERLTDLSELFGNMIGASADRRNSLLDGALSSKWDQLTDKLNAAGIETETFQNKIKELAKSHNVDLDSMIEKEGSFEKALIKCFTNGKLDKSILKDAIKSLVGDITGATEATGQMAGQMEKYGEIVNKVINGDFGSGEARIKALTDAGYDYATVQNLVNEQLGSSVRHLSSLSEEQLKSADNLSKLSDEQLKNKGYTEEQITALRDLQKAADDSGSSINELINEIERPSGADLIWDSLFDAIYSVIEPIQAVGKAWREIFPPMTSDQLYGAIEGFNRLTGVLHSFATNSDNLDKITRSFKGLFAALDIVTTIAGGGFKLAFKTLSMVLQMFDMNVLDLTATLGDAIVAFRDFLFDNELINKAFELMAKGAEKAVKAIQDLFNAFKNLPQVQNIVKRIKEAFDDLQNLDLSEIGKNIIEGLQNGLGEGLSSIPGKIIELAQAIIETFCGILGIHSPSTVFFEFGQNIVEGLANGIAAGIKFVIDGIRTLAEKIIETFKNAEFDEIANFFEEGFDKFKEILSGFDYSKLLAIIPIAAVLLMIKKIYDISSALADGINNFNDVLDGLALIEKKFAKVLGAFATNLKANALNKIAISIAILVGALISLTFVDSDKLYGAVAVIGILSGILIGLAVAMDKMNGVSAKLGKGGLNVEGLKNSLVSIGIALLLLAATVKMIGTMKPQQAIQGFVGLAGLITAVGLVFAAFGALAKFSGTSGIDKAGSMLLKMSIAMMLMVGVVKLAGGLSVEEMGKGAAFVAAFAIFVTYLVQITKIGKEQQIAKLGGLLLSMSVSLLLMVGVCKLVSKLTLGEALAGAAFVAAFVLLIKALVKVTTIGSEQQMAKVAGTILAMSIAIGILAGVAVLLSMMPLDGLAKGVVAVSILGLVMAGMIKATQGASKVVGNIVAITVAVAVMAGAVVALSMIDGSKLAGATAALSILMGMFALMAKGMGSVTTSLGSLIVMTVAIGVLAGLLYMLASLPIEASISAAASLSILLLSMSASMAIISTAGVVAPTALVSIGVMTLVVASLAVIIGLLSKCEVGSTLEIAMSLSTLLLALSGACVILSAVGMTGPAAFVGVGALMTLIASVGGLMIAIGALATYFPQMEEFLNRGLPILEKIGYGLGSFFGNIVGGFTDGVTSGLPEVANNLSTFMSNLQPFIDGAKGIDETALTGVTSLVKMMAMLSGANILESIASWLTGGSSMEMFATQLDAFGDAIVSFSNKVAGNINEESVLAAANAGKMLAEMATSIPNSGGAIAFFTGENDLSVFSSQLDAFADGIVSFSNKVKGNIDEEAVTAAANAGNIMAQMASTIPNTGGVLAFFAGDNDMATFGTQLESFGSAIANFSNSVKGNVDEEAITAAANAGNIMVQLSNTIPNRGGVLSFFSGDNDLASFGSQLVIFGEAMKSYSESVTGLDTGAINASVPAAQGLVEVANSISSSGGILSFFTGDNSLSSFGSQLAPFGKSMKKYADAVSGMDTAAIAESSTAVSEIVKAVNSTSGIQTDGVTSFKNACNTLGKVDLSKVANALSSGSDLSTATGNVKKLVSAINSTAGVDTSGVKSFKNAIDTLGKVNVNNFIKAFTGSTAQLSSAGSKMMDAVIKGIKSKQSALTSTANSTIDTMLKVYNSKASTFRSTGVKLMNQFISGINSMKSKVSSAVTSGLNTAVSRLRGYYRSFYSAGSYVASGFAAGIRSRISSAASAAASMAAAASAAARRNLNIHSPSKVFYGIGGYAGQGFVNALLAYASKAYKAASGMAESARSGLSNAISKISDVVDMDMDVQPTIRPVLDLSEIESGAGTISSMLDTQPSLGVLSNVGAINTMMNRRIQNGTTDDVISAIKDLKSTIGKSSGDSYTIGGVTYDEGSSVANAVNSLIRALRIEGRI